MRILVLTNFYPPLAWGGEEQSCRQVVEGLERRGHAALVLTSMHGTNNRPVEAEGILRSLYLEMDIAPWQNGLTFFARREAREQHNLRCLEHVLERFDPDIVFIWGMWNLHRSLAALAEAQYPDRLVYRFATYWPTLPSQHELYWRTPGRKWFSRLPKHALGRIALAMLARESGRTPLAFRHAICVSAATRNVLVEAGIPVSNARIIHTGLDLEGYLNGGPHPPRHGGRGLRLLCAGRLSPEKGIETAIEAMAKLVIGQGRRHLELRLAGSGSAEYEGHLRRLVSDAGLNGRVSFLGRVPPEDMPGLLRGFDVLLVPSVWEEPFARAVLEGMLSGLAVVATSTGGTPEVVSDGDNGLLVAPGDPEDLARAIARLAEDPASRRAMGRAARQTVLDRFTATRMMDEIERFLHEIASTPATVGPRLVRNPLEDVTSTV